MLASRAKKLGDTDTLDRLSQTHVVRQNGAPRPGDKSNAFELIRQQGSLEQRGAQGVVVRIAANFFDLLPDAGLVQPLLNKLFRVWVD